MFDEKGKWKDVDSFSNVLKSAMLEYFDRSDWPRLTPRAFMVWAALLGQAAPLVGITAPSWNQIRKMTGLGSKSTVQKGLAELFAKGYIEKVHLPKESNNVPDAYRLLRRGKNEANASGPELKKMQCICDTIDGVIRKEERKFFESLK